MTPGEPTSSPFLAATPIPEPDAYRTEIPLEPWPGEFGIHTFCRDIAAHLTRLLHGPATSLIYRENPWDRRPCPQAWFLDLHVADHLIHIVGYPSQRPLQQASSTTHALTLDGRPVEFERNYSESLAWQIARDIWTAAIDSPTTD
ncbi:MAG TPA: hypothetical protein VLJ88_11630 [Propionibacteriaceae bacterium]|nr:hypothetical protein [Propionibacteriaceae bacterium]